MNFYAGKRVLVCGGASFIGSHLTEALVVAGAVVRVADDLSSGKLANLAAVGGRIDFQQRDLRDQQECIVTCNDTDIVFHLAAAHGGRGYVDTHPAACAQNILLDSQVFDAAIKMGVKKIVYASSACVYPVSRLDNPDEALYLTEDMAGPPFAPDGVYGWAKMTGEVALRAYAEAGRIQAAVCRFFHVYGPRMLENHALAAFMARAYIKADPFVVWGDGRQVRDWIHVSDIVSGLLLAGERISDGTPVNLGTGLGYSVIGAARWLCTYTPSTGESGKATNFKFELDKPTGPQNRVADITRARNLLGWEPQVKLHDGLRDTYRWYVATHDAAETARTLDGKLMER
jgi:nucleoside-diphosphate-sugar epimerase